MYRQSVLSSGDHAQSQMYVCLTREHPFTVLSQVHHQLLLQALPAVARDRLRLEHPQDPVAVAAAAVELHRPLPAAPQAALVRVSVLLIELSCSTSNPQHSLKC